MESKSKHLHRLHSSLAGIKVAVFYTNPAAENDCADDVAEPPRSKSDEVAFETFNFGFLS